MENRNMADRLIDELGTRQLPPTFDEVKDNVIKISHELGKIWAIKYHRAACHCGLKESKDAVERVLADYDAEMETVVANGIRYKRTEKIFDVENLVRDCPCTPGLHKYIVYCINNQLDIYSDFRPAQFNQWWNEEGYQHAIWLKEHDYLEVVKTPAQKLLDEISNILVTDQSQDANNIIDRIHYKITDFYNGRD